MDNSKISKEEYNSEPVYYCKDCLSLLTELVPFTGDDFCSKCGSTNIGTCSIEEWEEMFKAKHGGTRFLDFNY